MSEKTFEYSVVFRNKDYLVVADELDEPDATGVNAYVFKRSGKVVGIFIPSDIQMMHKGQECTEEYLRDLEKKGII